MKIYYHNRLPHIAPIAGTFFITFRLANSLPKKIINDLQFKLECSLKELQKNDILNYNERSRELKKTFFYEYDKLLDRINNEKCFLFEKAIAEVVINKLNELDGQLYDLLAYCIMPNHVHILFDTSVQISNDGLYLRSVPDSYKQLYQIMKLIKGSTARLANKILGRKGEFWMKDSYDRYIRNETELLNTINYIANNPVNAGLATNWEDYPFTFVKENIL